jgi:uncharacterized protein YgiM (DUF1202 family)
MLRNCLRPLTIAAVAILAGALSLQPNAASAATRANRACDGFVSVSLTNVRSGPGLDYGVESQLPYGAPLTAIGFDLTAKWYIVYLPQDNNTVAHWIHRRNVRLTTNCVKALQLSAAQTDR